MKNFYAFLIICLIAISFNACSETGLEGPEGPAGPQGVAGNAGAVGAAGKDGSIIYSGTGTPPATLGTNGDYYLDRAIGNLYGPKTANGWATPLTLMGAAGTNGTNGTNGVNGSNGSNGTNGSTTLSGNGIPSSSAGIAGDYYLDKTNFQLYGPKTASGWGIPILLRGADGAQGPTGAAGKDGSIIYSGTGVPAAAIGINGDYYLDKTTGNLYGPKTAGAWGTPVVLKGTNGANGTNGTNGTNGANGTNGSNGSNGTNGSTTLSGNGAPLPAVGAIGDYYLDKTNYLLYGPKDNTGWGVPILLRGAAGAQGPTGPAGADGTVIYSGETAPDPALGKNGDFYISRLPVMIYGPKTALFGWGAGTSLKGADGTNGTNGSNGTNGTNGNMILSGGSLPQNTQGNNGDFYIDLSTYVMYGPKAGGVWSFPGVSLKGADGNANVMAFETPDNVTFGWFGYESSNYILRKQGVAANDTTTVFTIPATYNTAVKQGVVLVYMRKNLGSGSYTWQQLDYTDKSNAYTVTYTYRLRVNPTDARLRISYADPFVTHQSYPVDKVRIVIIPASSVGTLSTINPNQSPMLQAMQKLNLRDGDFKKIQ